MAPGLTRPSGQPPREGTQPMGKVMRGGEDPPLGPNPWRKGTLGGWGTRNGTLERLEGLLKSLNFHLRERFGVRCWAHVVRQDGKKSLKNNTRNRLRKNGEWFPHGGEKSGRVGAPKITPWSVLKGFQKASKIHTCFDIVLKGCYCLLAPNIPTKIHPKSAKNRCRYPSLS